MEASELRTISVDELNGRIRQWRDDLFRASFKSEASEAKDTSVIRKLRHDIARAFTVLSEKSRGIEVVKKASVKNKDVAGKPKKTAAKKSATPQEG